ncbi:MAG TPA: sigma-70 family RNA polymerase sigma factor [Chloroflexota bacterium]|nr:sigma-70 family RNA polymerase sigma factor [Chloroflexota bacterium]
MVPEHTGTGLPSSPPATGGDDNEAVAAARAGDAVAFNRLVLRYQDAVYTLCFRLTGNAEDAADAAQEAFLSAYQHLDGFRGGAFRSWLLRIAANASYDLLRQRKRRPAASLDRPAREEDDAPGPALDVPDPAIGPEGQALRAEFDRLVQAGLLELPEDQRLAVVLCDIYEFDYATIAATTGVELGTVKSRINRGRRRLRDYLLAHREPGTVAHRPSS